MSQNPYNYINSPSDAISFLNEISEHYANLSYFKDTTPEKLLTFAEQTLPTIPGIDKIITKYEMPSIFEWECTSNIYLMKDWFKLMKKIGGDPLYKNSNGFTSLDVARKRLLREGFSNNEATDFINSMSNQE